ncbi:MAG: hypothetical protein Q8Q50_03490 [Methylobacter sp.]|nr:hypothetical protein [Methylobacter sp.]
MALKIQQLTPAAETLTSFAAVPAGKEWLWDINICSRAQSDVTIRLAVTVGATTAYLEYGRALSPGEPLERTSRKLPENALVKVWASEADVDFTLEYVEE